MVSKLGAGGCTLTVCPGKGTPKCIQSGESVGEESPVVVAAVARVGGDMSLEIVFENLESRMGGSGAHL